MAPGDTVVFGTIAYLIIEYSTSEIEISPGLQDPVFDGDVGNVIPAQEPPTTFRTVEEVSPKTILEAIVNGDYDEGDTEFLITVTQGTPEVGQDIEIAGTEMQYEIIDAIETTPPNWLITIAPPGLVFPIVHGLEVTQTRKQLILIENRVGDIFEDDPVKLGVFTYIIIGYQEDPEGIAIASPGVLETIPEHTIGTIYH